MEVTNNSAKPKQVVSIRISPQVYQQLKSEVGRGRISAFIEKLITQELQNQEQKLAQEYQEAAQDKKRWKEARAWEQAQAADWNKYDDGENN